MTLRLRDLGQLGLERGVGQLGRDFACDVGQLDRFRSAFFFFIMRIAFGAIFLDEEDWGIGKLGSKTVGQSRLTMDL